ncbi:MAG: HPt (histidine-containing phosphotransfer) domain-containing protein [Paracoccaceae bacterium]|jgi:HPt (histidine-containing phosphotransfer) domain-containing protein
MSDDPIDRSVFAELQDAMGADFVGELVGTFFEEAPGMLAELKTAVETGAPDTFRRAAHSIKSNASIFGAQQLAELARQMEISGLRPAPAETSAQVSALKAEYDRMVTTLKDLQNG